jgi:hypothetical protein
MKRNTKTVRWLVTAAIAATVLAGVALAAPQAAIEKAATGGLRFGGTLAARPIGPMAARRDGVPPKPLATASLYDSATGATLVMTGNTPRSFMGSVFTLIDPLLTPIQITDGTLYMGSIAAVSYTNVVANIQFWDTYSGASTPVFSSATGAVQSFSLGAVSTAASSFYTIPVTFSTPITFAALADRGFAVNYQGDTGPGLANTDNLTSLIRYGPAMATGSSSLNGYYRNVSTRTDFNFLPTDLRSLSLTNQGIAIILNGNATFPVSLQKLSVE